MAKGKVETYGRDLWRGDTHACTRHELGEVCLMFQLLNHGAPIPKEWRHTCRVAARTASVMAECKDQIMVWCCSAPGLVDPGGYMNAACRNR